MPVLSPLVRNNNMIDSSCKKYHSGAGYSTEQITSATVCSGVCGRVAALALLGVVEFGLASSYFLRFQNKCVIPCDCEPLELLSFKYRVLICKQYGSQVQVRMHFALNNTTTFYTRKIRTLYNYCTRVPEYVSAEFSTIRTVRMISQHF